MKFRRHYAYDADAASAEATIPADQQGESLTVQSQSEDADINVMMRRFGVTGKMPENPRVPQYGDFSGVIGDYQSALNAVIDAQDSFMEFPANVRERFKNSPQLMMEFCDVRENWDEAKKLGILSDESIKARAAAAEAALAARKAEILEVARSAGWKAPEAPEAPAPVVP